MQALLLRGDPLAPTHDVGERDEGNRQAGRTPGGGTLQTTMLAFLLIQDGPRETENQLCSVMLPYIGVPIWCPLGEPSEILITHHGFANFNARAAPFPLHPLHYHSQAVSV